MPLDFISVKKQIQQSAAEAPAQIKHLDILRRHAGELLAAYSGKQAELRAKVEQAAAEDSFLRSAKPTEEALNASFPLPKAPAQATIIAYRSLAAYANLEIIRTGQVDGGEMPKLEQAVKSAVTWTSDLGAQVVLDNRQAVAVVGLKQPGIVYQTDGPDNPRLRLVKLSSTNHALPGEEVEFTLRLDNIGDQEIGNVTIVDNLATRLEYVANSAQSTLPASFSAVPNGAGSSVLRWEIKEPLSPGAGGVLQFTARVR